MKILYDIGFYKKKLTDSAFAISITHYFFAKKYHYKIEIYKDNHPLAQDSYLTNLEEVNELRSKYKFTHKVRACEYYWSKEATDIVCPTYCGRRYIKVDLHLLKWGCERDHWGYNRAHPLDDNILDKEYQIALRTLKLENILNG